MGTVVKPGFYDGAFKKAGQWASDEALAAAPAAAGPERDALIQKAIEALESEAFTADGKPKTDAIDAAMPEEPVLRSPWSSVACPIEANIIHLVPFVRVRSRFCIYFVIEALKCKRNRSHNK